MIIILFWQVLTLESARAFYPELISSTLNSSEYV